MSLFDTYEPAAELTCPACGRALRRWQGKDGPCALFVWREGVAAPVDQHVDDEIALPHAERDAIRLPSTFVIYSYDCPEHLPVEARCECVHGVWASTALLLSASSADRRFVLDALLALKAQAVMAAAAESLETALLGGGELTRAGLVRCHELARTVMIRSQLDGLTESDRTQLLQAAENLKRADAEDVLLFVVTTRRRLVGSICFAGTSSFCFAYGLERSSEAGARTDD